MLTWHYPQSESRWDLQHRLWSLLLSQQTNQPGNARSSGYVSRSLPGDQGSQPFINERGQPAPAGTVGASAWASSAISVSLGAARHDISTGCSTMKPGRSLLCHMLCISISGCLLTQSKALDSHSLSPSQKSLRGCAELLRTSWKNSLGKQQGSE